MKNHAILVAFLLALSLPALPQSTAASQSSPQDTQARGYWLDPTTKLMWAAKDNGKDVRWSQAMNYCSNLRLAGFSDWRLATLDELQGIFDKSAESPGENPRSRWHETEPMSFHVKGNLFLTGIQWTSSQKMDDRGRPSGYAWRFDFNEGRPFDGDELSFATNKRALCVRPSMLAPLPQSTTAAQSPAQEQPTSHLAAPDFFITLGGGSGLDANGQPTAFVDAKLGGEFGVGLEYDRLAATNAFSVEGFLFEPIFRVPSFNRDRARTFFEFYPEPAVGFRSGGGPFGGYASAGGMFLIKKDSNINDVVPYVEIRHRFPFSDPMNGDTRFGFGVMFGAT